MASERTSFVDFLERDSRKLDPATERFGAEAVDALIEVHRHLGPGHPERVYENALCMELTLRGVPFQRQVPIQVLYKGEVAGEGCIDLLVGECVILELKAVDQLSPTHRAQLGSYLVATKLNLGYLVNFNVALLKDGLKRVVRSDP